jgi:crotonobetainyl-CoA:carnitine CoA-transferase CaiB-like acyl-CoA transferase
VYRSPDGWLVLLCLDRQWPNLAAAMGRPDLLEDTRFATNADRVANRECLEVEIEGWLAGFPDDDAALAALDAARVPCSKVLTPADAVTDRYFVERKMVRTIHDPVVGDFTVAGFPFKFSGRPDGPDTDPDLRAPGLGEHNAEVLGEVLGMGADEVAALRGDGLLHDDPNG